MFVLERERERESFGLFGVVVGRWGRGFFVYVVRSRRVFIGYIGF